MDAKIGDLLPFKAQNFVRWVENQLEVPIVYIGTGPRRNQMIFREPEVWAS
jgi:adenylosuccinate synthase